MRTRFLRAAPLLVLILAALACSVNLGSEDSGAAPITPAPLEEATEAVEPAVTEEPTVEAQPQAAATEEPVDSAEQPTLTTEAESSGSDEGMFLTTSNDDVSDLPSMAVPPVGIGGIFCEGATNGNISYRQVTGEFGLLCLYGLNPTTEGPSFTAALTGPDGSEYTQSYSIGQGPYGLAVLDSQGNVGGMLEIDNFGGSANFVPALGLDFFTGANVPAGQWTISVTADNGTSIAPTTFSFTHSPALVSDAPQPSISPLDESGFSYSAGETIYFFGTNYVPGQTLSLILYTADPSGAVSDVGSPILLPQAATTVTVDGSGKFEAQYRVGGATLKGGYYAITDDQFDADFELSGFMRNPFVGAFDID